MFCKKCGTQLDDNMKFCVKCGTPLTEIAELREDYTPTVRPTQQYEKEVSESKKGNPLKGILLVLVFVLIGVLGVGAFLIGRAFLQNNGNEEPDFEGYLELAEECMDQEDFEGAIGYYLDALEIEVEDEDLYLDLAKAYIENGDEEDAVEILQEGYEQTEHKKIKEFLEEEFGVTVEESAEDGAGKVAGEEDGTKEDKGDEANVEAAAEEALQPYTGVRTDINIEVKQVDNTNFPEMVFYTSVTDASGNTVENLTRQDFKIQEIDAQGNVLDATIDDVYQVLNEDKINVNLVLDASGSMDSYNKMQQAKNAAISFLDKVSMENGDKVEVISFGSYVYLEQEFSNNRSLVSTAVQDITTGGGTALYDALYAGLFQTYYEEGAKCVIGFTDGMENSSSYTFEDVVNLARNTGIPLFIVGIGEEYDADVLMNLAGQCSGKYYSANVNDLESILEDIYLTIYKEQQDYYVFKYTSQDLDNPHDFREIVVQTSEASEFSGSYRKSYVPEADIYGVFSSSYTSKDYMIPDSNLRTVTESDLAGMSLAELRIARNEIFARHGRQFKDPMLNQWFYSKTWYLNVPLKYAPDDFDAVRPSPLSSLELENAYFIKAYEEDMMATRNIYPDAGSVLLSDYDLALSKPVLRTALQQLQTYSYTNILGENMRLIEEAIAKEEVQY